MTISKSLQDWLLIDQKGNEIQFEDIDKNWEEYNSLNKGEKVPIITVVAVPDYDDPDCDEGFETSDDPVEIMHFMDENDISFLGWM